jgi:hypothetical protein
MYRIEAINPMAAKIKHLMLSALSAQFMMFTTNCPPSVSNQGSSCPHSVDICCDSVYGPAPDVSSCYNYGISCYTSKENCI